MVDRRWFERRCGNLGVVGALAATVLVSRWTAAGVLAMGAPNEVLFAPHAAKAQVPSPPFHSTGVDPAKVREAFDSSLRPDVASGGVVGSESVDGEPAVCPGVRVVAIAYCADPSWAFAALVSDGDGAPPSVLRRAGGMVGERRVERVGVDRVWLQGDAGLCEARLTPPPPPVPQPPRATHRPADPAIAHAVQHSPGGEIEIDRGLVQRFQNDPAQLATLGSLAPERDASGKFLGLRVTGLKPGGLPSVLGLQDGDRLGTVNGFGLGDPAQMLEAYTRLYSADMLHLEIVRQGKPVSIDYHIR